MAGNPDDLFEEIDTLTVSRLRPMVDLMKMNDHITEVWAARNSGNFHKIRQSGSNEVYCYEMCKYLPDSQFIGWLPIPIYKPEKE